MDAIRAQNSAKAYNKPGKADGEEINDIKGLSIRKTSVSRGEH